nr:phosphorylase b kinase regulatory subunit beta-like [Biomphalaria glabrata]
MLNIKLNGFYMLSKHQILRNQSPINGLSPSIGSDKNTNRIAHVQNSIYCAVAVWSLAQVYKKIDDDQGSIISWANLMIGRKVQIQLSPAYALHSTLDLVTGYPAYRGKEYEHLQIINEHL